MIKFWKSAAKGKSGCPVRPPEAHSSHNIQFSLLDANLQENCDDNSNIFEKKSKLSLNLHDILFAKTAINYFMIYMEGIGKQDILKCWLELNNFKPRTSVICVNAERNLKLNHTKSLDNDSNENELDKICDNFVLHKFGWRTSNTNLRKTKSDCSASSCVDLTEKFENKYELQNVNINGYTDVTERAINLFKKYVALEAPIQLDISDTVRKLVISNICRPEGVKDDCFKPVLELLYQKIEENYFNGFQNSPLYTKSQIDILTSGCINLKDILYNETILFYFTEYLEQEMCSNLLEFLIAAMNFRDNLINDNKYNSETAQDDAIVLYDKYFSLQATNPLGFQTDIRLKVESDICSELYSIHTCFDTPLKIVFTTLSKYVKTFLGSELYYNYLSEMIKSVDHLWSANYKSHSDCSSEFSVSTRNTLLAMGDPHFRKKRNHSVPDMTIDSNQLYNADSLWQRKKHDGLSLGRINSLGRFESKFEPDPDKKGKSVLKKMVSKFVPINTSKVEEEMAWQIANMIVKDVTDLTMAPRENENDHNI